MESFDFKMPSLGAEMEFGRLMEWKVKVGDRVHRGDIVAVVDTDKAAIEVEIWKEGVLREIQVKPGERVPVGAVLAKFEGVGTEVEAQSPIRAAPSSKTQSIQKVIASLMERSKREIPHYYLLKQIEISRLEAWLDKENVNRPVTEQLLMISPILKAIALACQEVPELNGQYVNSRFEPAPTVNLGVVISLREGGLVAPAIRDAEKLKTRELMSALVSLVERARSGVIRSSEFASASITVTNLMDSSVEEVLGIIFPPQVAILGIGASYSIGPSRWIKVSLSGDHRASDGRGGARFLQRVDELLQTPEALG